MKTNKSDYIDAEAIAEAVERPNMRCVPIKTEDQLDWQAVHRSVTSSSDRHHPLLTIGDKSTRMKPL